MDPQWPTGVASQRKLANVNLRTQTCDGWRNGLGRRRKFNASSKKVISVRPCTRARTKENNSEINLRLLALGGHTVKSLRSLVCKVELDQSERKSSQVHASHGQTESQVNTSYQLATPFGRTKSPKKCGESGTLLTSSPFTSAPITPGQVG